MNTLPPYGCVAVLARRGGWRLAAALGVLGAALACAQPATAGGGREPNEIFQQAGRAYDAGRYAEAAGLYEQLLADGHRAVPVLFNLANAHFRAGQFSAAVLAYRQAWYLAPRDADLRANLQFALEQTGAALPAVSLTARLWQAASLREWLWVAVAGFWLSAALACGLWLAPYRRAVWRGLLLIGVAALLLGLAGAGYWVSLLRQPEAVVLQPTKVLWSPLDGATERFALPAGALVRIERPSGEWLEISRGPQLGWIPRARCATVYSLQTLSSVLN